MIDFGVSKLKRGGRMVLVGQPTWDAHLTLYHFREFYRGRTIIDSQGGLANPAEDINRYAELWHTGQLDLLWLIGQQYDLADINKAFEEHTANVGRTMVKING
jgi:Zn-dependent alcohol dehydrogenase